MNANHVGWRGFGKPSCNVFVGLISWPIVKTNGHIREGMGLSIGQHLSTKAQSDPFINQIKNVEIQSKSLKGLTKLVVEMDTKAKLE